MEPTKKCYRCKETKPRDEFYRAAVTKDGRRPRCKACEGWTKRSRVEQREWTLRRRYKLTYTEFLALAAQQEGRCAICEQLVDVLSFYVDHDHTCCPGEITCGSCLRALLCKSCNLNLGRVEQRDWLEKALAYVQRWRSPKSAAS